MYDYFYDEQSEQYHFLQMPWLLIKDEQFKTISSDAKILYSLLLNRTSLSKKNGWKDENGRVYLIYTVDEIKDDLNCGRDKAIKSMQELTKKGLVETVRRGLGKPNLVYVKNFATSLKYTPPSNKEPVNPVNTQKSEISTSGNRNIRLQEVDISDTSNTDISNTDFINTKSESMSMSTSDMEDKHIKTDETLTTTPDVQYIKPKKNRKEPPITAAVQSSVIESPLPIVETHTFVPVEDKFITYQQIIQDNIEYIHYTTHRSHDIDIVDELVNCMLDVICSVGATVKVNGEDKSREMVKSQYLKINSMDIDHIIDKFREQRHRITHVNNYLKTMLYTVKQEISAHYDNAIRTDGTI